MTDREEYLKWKQCLNALREKRSKAEGELESYRKELKEKFDIIDVDAAQKKLKELEKIYSDQSSMLATMLKAYQEEYGPEI